MRGRRLGTVLFASATALLTLSLLAAILDPLPFQLGVLAGSITYSVASKTIFISIYDCAKGAIRPDAIMSAGFDYEM